MEKGIEERKREIFLFGKGILFYPIFEGSDSFAEDEGP